MKKRKLKSYHVKSVKQPQSWSCGVHTIQNVANTVLNRDNIKGKGMSIEGLIKVWKGGFLLPLIDNLKRFDKKVVNGLYVTNIYQGREENIERYVDLLITPVIAISFAGRNKYKCYMAYTNKKGRKRRHVVSVIDYNSKGDLLLNDSAYGNYSWIRKEDRDIIDDVVYFNIKQSILRRVKSFIRLN